MEKAYREMLDVIRAEVAELYRLRRADAERLGRLERSARRTTMACCCEDGMAETRLGLSEADEPLL